MTAVTGLASVTTVDFGTAAPPTTLGGYSLTPFGPDNRGIGINITTVASPLGGNLIFGDGQYQVPNSPPGTGFRSGTTANYLTTVNFGWTGPWGNGYTGDIYLAKFKSLADSIALTSYSITLTLPPKTGAFLFYVSPDDVAKEFITVSPLNGSPKTVQVDGALNADGGLGGANAIGIYASPGDLVKSVTITSDIDVALGEFSIAEAVVPETSRIEIVAGLSALGYAGFRRLRSRNP